MKFISLKTAILIAFFSNIALAKVDTLMLSEANSSVSLYDFSEVYTTDLPENLAAIRKNKTWKTLQKNDNSRQKKYVWIHFFLKNPSDTSHQFFIRNPDNELTNYYILENGKLISTLKNGEFQSTWNMNDDQVVGVNSFNVASKNVAEIYIEASNYQGFLPFLRIFPQKNIRTTYYLKTEQEYQKWLNTYLAHNLNELQVRVFYQGGLGVIFIIILLIFYRNRNEKLYKYYLLYVFAAFIFTLAKSRNFTYIGKLLGIFPVIKFHLSETIMWLGFATYLYFISELLDLRKTHQKLFRFINQVSKSFIIYGFVIFFWMIITNDSGLQSKLFFITRLPLLFLHIGILAFTTIKVKSTMVKYVILSNGLLIIFGIVAWLKAGILNHQQWYGILNHIFTLPFAILLEMIVFALAIAKKIGDDRKLRNELEKKAVEVEMMALRSQMNPHFIFNSLNTVRYFVLSDQKEKAKNYLSKFSKLLRTILTYSKENTILLSNELEAINLYIDVELGRFESNFFYSIQIDEKIDLDSVMIPPLLLQPFVENAIIHGLRNSEKSKKVLEIKVFQTNEEILEISITDNGIGRTKANEIQYNQDILHKSFGTAITNQRIELFNQSYAHQIKVETTDLANESGTQVLIQIKI